jgi:hypothetical protein
MGFFSWNCAVSRKSIANRYSGRPANESDCYLVTPNKTYHEPSYEGYGDFGGVDVYELLGDGDREKGIDDYYEGTPKFQIKIVSAKYYSGQKYDELKASTNCEYQGYFYPEDEEYEVQYGGS